MDKKQNMGYADHESILRLAAVGVMVITAIFVAFAVHKSRNPDNVNDDKKSSVTTDQYIDYPVLNVATDNPLIGDEHKFLRIAEYSPGDIDATDFSTEENFTLEAGKSYILMACLHNAAEPKSNGENDVRHPVATLSFTEEMTAGETHPVAIVITYPSEDDVEFQSDQIELIAQTNVTLVVADALDGLNDETVIGRAMQSFPEQEAYAPLTPTVSNIDGTILQTIILPDIEPGYENASYLFFRFDTL